MHVVAVNPPPGVSGSERVSVLAASGIPLRTQHARAVALGADVTDVAWVAEAERVLLPGLRIVIENEAAATARIDALAKAGGVLVGEKRAR